MAIWNPYIDSMLSIIIEEKEAKPPSKTYDLYGNGCVPTGNPGVYPSYPNPRPSYTGPAAPVSPSISNGSNSPGNNAYTKHAAPYNPFCPYAFTPTLLSPPESLPSASSQQTYMDVDTLSDDSDFQEFKTNAMKVMAEKNGGSILGNNPKMRRAVRSNNQNATNDSYREQRMKNNRAAKQSRDRRKLREIHQMLKLFYLKKEVARLKMLLASNVCGRCHQVCESDQ